MDVKLRGKRPWVIGAAAMCLGLLLAVLSFGLPARHSAADQSGCCYGPAGTLYCDPPPQRWFECCSTGGLRSPWLALIALALFARRRGR